MWELDHKESWALKNWCFWTAVLEKTLETPLDCKGSNQSILKEISPGFSLEGLMLKLKLQHFGHLIRRTDSFEKTLMLGKIEGRRKGGWHRMRWLDGINDSMDMGVSKLRELVKDREAWRAAVLGITKNRTGLSDWTTTKTQNLEPQVQSHPVLVFLADIKGDLTQNTQLYSWKPIPLFLKLFWFIFFAPSAT